ncbi:SRPBCC family protein [Actinacidiphila alni]|uniref:SRPBCC family protein n=1 Tax=Actinacidiphila alni TaxID=380248 RepID=UPI003452A7C4
MPTYQTSITIHASVERVWAVLTDVENWPALTASMTSVRGLDGREIAVGSRFEVEQPKLRKAVWTVTDLTEGTRFSWESASTGVTTRGDHLLVADGADTRMTLVVHQRGALAGLVGLVAGGMTRRYIGMEAAGLKERSEAPA